MSMSGLSSLMDREFPLSEEICYLNHAAVAPWPKRTAQAVIDFANENSVTGAQRYPNWLKVESQLRKQLKTLIGASTIEEIALTKSTSEALSFVAYGLTWSEGDEIIICDQEFPSNRIVWESLQAKFGVRVVVVDISAQSDPEQAIINSLTAKTRLVSLSSVQYGTGFKLNLGLIGSELRKHDILFCVDAIQSVGVCPINVEQECIDFLMADGHKWMLGPEGLALFYIRKNCQDLLNLTEYGWHMIKNRGDYSLKTWEIAEDATRFECGSPNMVSAQALNASISLLLEVGIEKIAEMVTENIHLLYNNLSQIEGIEFVTDLSENRTAGILTFTHESINAQLAHEALMKKGVICAYRGGGIRFSPHFYTSTRVLTNAVDIVEQHINGLIL